MPRAKGLSGSMSACMTPSSNGWVIPPKKPPQRHCGSPHSEGNGTLCPAARAACATAHNQPNDGPDEERVRPAVKGPLPRDEHVVAGLAVDHQLRGCEGNEADPRRQHALCESAHSEVKRRHGHERNRGPGISGPDFRAARGAAAGAVSRPAIRSRGCCTSRCRGPYLRGASCGGGSRRLSWHPLRPCREP